jgi:branched chain amino acid efflux pump
VSDVWTTVIVLAVVTALIRASGPVSVGGRELPPKVMRVIALMAASLLAALVVVETFAGGDDTLELDERALGVAASGRARSGGRGGAGAGDLVDGRGLAASAHVNPDLCPRVWWRPWDGSVAWSRVFPTRSCTQWSK